MVVFLCLGLGLYVLVQRFGVEDTSEIVIDDATLRYHRSAFAQEHGRPPSASELTRLLRKYIEEEAMYREAVRLGMDKHDQIVRRRLVQMIEFMYQDLGEQRVDERCAEGRREDEPPQQLVLANFEQRFFADASGVTSEAAMLGRSPDSFPLGSTFDGMAPENVRAHFGEAVTRAVFELPTDAWHGPFPSAYGSHWVRVSERKAVGEDEQGKKARMLDCRTAGRKGQLAEAVQALIETHGVTIPKDVAEQLPELSNASDQQADGTQARGGVP